jgi:UbiD family decarboxylase
MAYNDLQEYLARLEAAGKLHRVAKPVDPAWEVAAVTRQTFDQYGWDERPALCFERVGESEYPLVVGVVGGSPAIYAHALSTTVDQIDELWRRAQQQPIDPVLVPDGQCKEVVVRDDDVNLQIFPHAVWTPGADPGPYITAPLVVTKDPETGGRNVGTYRLQVKGPRRLGIYMTPTQHGARHLAKHEQAGQDMPVAVVIGADPTVVLASVTKFPYTMDEYRVAGGLRGEPVPLVRCETADLEVPAHAEIVLEGVIRAGFREDEGPFGEYSGYMGASGLSSVIELTCITRRRRPVYQAFLSQMPPSESSCIRSVGRSAGLLRHLRDLLGLPVTDVHFTESGGANAIVVVAMRKDYPEQVKEMAMGAWSFMNKEIKYLIAVDDDVDVRNPFQVEWAMSFRTQPAQDTWVLDGVLALGLDPSTAPADVPQHDPRRRVGSKMLIDATRKHVYPQAARVPRQYLDTVQGQWAEYGFER